MERDLNKNADKKLNKALIDSFNCLIKEYKSVRKDIEIVKNLKTKVFNHNQLNDIQGGIFGEYFHLTLQELEKLHSLKNVTDLKLEDTSLFLTFDNTTEIILDLTPLLNKIKIKEDNTNLVQDYVFFDLNEEHKQKDFNEKVQDIIEKLARNIEPPVYEQPLISLTELSNKRIVEINSPFSVHLLSTFIPGDAGELISHKVFQNNTLVQESTDYYISKNINGTVVPGITTFYTTVEFGEGLTKNNYLDIPDSRGKILTGSITSYIYSLEGVYPVYYTTLEPSEELNTDDMEIFEKLIVKSHSTVSIPFRNVIGKKLVVLIPNVYPTKTKWYVDPLNKGTIGNTGDLFNMTEIRNCNTRYVNNVPYKVYISTPTNLNVNIELQN